MPERDEWWCYCGLAFWTSEGLTEHQTQDHTNGSGA
jgi:hypothetical protein